MNIKKVLFKTKVFCTLISIFCTIGLLYILTHDFRVLFDQTRRGIMADCQIGTMQAASKFNEVILKSRKVITEVAPTLEKMMAENCDREEISRFLDDQGNYFRDNLGLNFTTLYGYIYEKYLDDGTWTPPESYQPKIRPWYTYTAQGKGKIVVVPPYLDPITGQIVVTIGRLLSDGESVLAIDNYFHDVVSYDSNREHKEALRFLLDRHGNLITETLGNNTPTSPDYSKFTNELHEFITKHQSLNNLPELTTINGEECTVLTSILLDNWWGITVIRHKNVYSSVLSTLIPHLITTLAISLLIFLLINMGFRWIQREHNEAIAANHSKTLFFAMVSHEIRTPLNSIIGFSRILRDCEIDKATSKEYLDHIVSSGQSLAQIINDILDLSKMDAGKIMVENEVCVFPKLLAAVCGPFELRAAQNNNKLLQVIESDFPKVKLDPSRTKQILFNIIGNALKFTNYGVITVKASFDKGENHWGTLVCSVADTGVGISKETLKTILDPFVSAHKQGDNQGTGLGLPICAKLISQMNGTLHIESELGAGSVFTITLNNVEYLDEAGNETCTLEKTLAPAYDSLPLKLLLCDDVELNLKVLSVMLRKRFGAQVVCVHSGQEVIEKLEGEQFDALLTDMWMPEMNGTQLLHYVRQESSQKTLPVYVITADVTLLDSWQETGFNGVITKPITPESMTQFCQDMKQRNATVLS